MSELSVTLLRLGFLLLLWVLVLTSIAVLRSDLYGTRVTSRGRGQKAKQPSQDKAPAPSRSTTGIRTGAVTTTESTAAHLTVTAGVLKGSSVPLGSSPIVVGRSPTCTLVIDDDYCSARHCRIFPDGDAWYIEDMGSTNGTWLGNQRVDDPIKFERGDVVRLGSTELELTA